MKGKKQPTVTDRTGRIDIGREAAEEGDKSWWKGTRATARDEKSRGKTNMFLSHFSLQTTTFTADSSAFRKTASYIMAP